MLVPPFDDPLVIAGQGTAGREIVEDLAALGLKPDVVVVGASGGGLIAGIALAIKARVPGAKFYTAEPEGFDDTARSFRSGKRETNARMSGTICDALMTNTPGAITFEINRKLVGEGVTASDAEVGRAVAFAFRELKLVVEPGGAIGLAALLAGKLDVKGKVVVGGALRRQCRRRAVPPVDRRLSGRRRVHYVNSAIRSSSVIAMSAASGPVAIGAAVGSATGGVAVGAGASGRPRAACCRTTRSRSPRVCRRAAHGQPARRRPRPIPAPGAATVRARTPPGRRRARPARRRLAQRAAAPAEQRQHPS